MTRSSAPEAFDWDSPRLLWWLVAACFVIRAVPAFLVFGTSDVISWQRFAEAIADDSILNLYSTIRPNYSPLVPYLNYFSLLAAKLTGLPFWGIVKLPSIAADCAVTVLIYRVFRNRGLPAFSAAALYAANPVSILVTSVHGQYDPFTMLFCLLAWYFHEFAEKRRDFHLSALSLGIAVMAKNFPVILVPLFLLRAKNTRDRLIFAAESCLPVALTMLPFLLATPGGVMDNVANYSSRFGHWGYMLLLNVMLNHGAAGPVLWLKGAFIAGGKYLLLALFALFYIRCARRERPLLHDIISLFLVFYFFTAGFGIQYLVWIVPFAALTRERGFAWYTLFGGLWMLFWYSTYISGGMYTAVTSLVTENLFWKAATLFALLVWASSGAWLWRRETGTAKNP